VGDFSRGRTTTSPIGRTAGNRQDRRKSRRTFGNQKAESIVSLIGVIHLKEERKERSANFERGVGMFHVVAQ